MFVVKTTDDKSTKERTNMYDEINNFYFSTHTYKSFQYIVKDNKFNHFMIMITLTTLRFDSDILEGQYWRSTFPRTTRRFQLGLFYILIMCLVSFDQDDNDHVFG